MHAIRSAGLGSTAALALLSGACGGKVLFEGGIGGGGTGGTGSGTTPSSSGVSASSSTRTSTYVCQVDPPDGYSALYG